MDTRIGNRIIFASAMMEGRTVTEISPASQASDEIKSIIAEISAMLFPAQKEAPEKKKTKKLAAANA
jgi:hypothetical protein